MKPRTAGQTLALVVVGAGLSTLLSVLLFGFLADRREAAQSAPLPGPIVPGHGTV